VVNKGTILLVDNDTHDTELLKQHFEKNGQRVLMVVEQASALLLAREELPQSIILDLETPGLDAAALIKEVRSTPRTRHIHITLLTPRGEHEDKLAALAAGADEFLSKPVDVEELGLRVRNALRRAAFDNLMNPTTGLPGPRLIEDQLRGLLRHGEQGDWAILRLSLRGFGPFGDVYGFLAGEEALRFAAHLFGQVVNRLGTPNDLLGHSGGDNFVLITVAGQVAALTAELTARFNEEVKTHYSFREREQGYLVFKDADGNEQHAPLMTLAVHAITAADGPFYDIRELTQALV
jgi:PleD family two-component response regulator